MSRDSTRDSSAAIGVIATLCGVALFAVGTWDALNFTVDDVFISFRYAENLARGLGPVFNPGERVEGFSNPLWTLMLAALARAGQSQASGPFAMLVASKLAGAAFALATVAVLATWSRRRSRASTTAPDDSAPLSLVVLGGSVSFSLWGVSGMETPMCALLVTLAGLAQMGALRVASAGGRPGPGLWSAAALYGLAAVSRPEPVFVWALATAVFVATAPRPLRGPMLRAAGLTAGMYLATTAARLGLFGAWLPNTVVAKASLTPVGAVLGAKYALAGVFAAVGFLGLGLLGLPSLIRRGLEWRWLALWCGAWILFVVGSGGDWMPGYRLLAPALPLLAVLVVASLAVFLEGRGSRLSSPGPALWVLAGAILAFASERTLVRAEWAFPSGIRQRTWESSPLRREVAADLGRRVAPGEVVALAECGYIPYYNPGVRFLDVLGLMDPEFARLPSMDVGVFLRRAPDWYLVMIKWGQPSRESVALLSSPEFRARYRPVASYDRLASRLKDLENGVFPPPEEEQTFVLYRRVP